jgi:hypothetical protein
LNSEAEEAFEHQPDCKSVLVVVSELIESDCIDVWFIICNYSNFSEFFDLEGGMLFLIFNPG